MSLSVWWNRHKGNKYKKIKSEEGVLTVEAVLVIPLMLFGFLCLIAFIQGANQLLQIDRALSQTAREMAKSAYTVQQGINLTAEDGKEEIILTEELAEVWAEACLKSYLPDYEALRPALAWEKVCLPFRRVETEVIEDVLEEDNLFLQISFRPAQTEAALSRLLPKSLCWQIVKEQRPWLVGRELLPYRGLERSVAHKTGIIVYVTRWGTRYHQDGCRYLAKSKIPYDLGELPAFYAACQVCRPVPRN